MCIRCCCSRSRSPLRLKHVALCHEPNSVFDAVICCTQKPETNNKRNWICLLLVCVLCTTWDLRKCTVVSVGFYTRFDLLLLLQLFICIAPSMSFAHKEKNYFKLSKSFSSTARFFYSCACFFALFTSVAQCFFFPWFSVWDVFSLQKLFWHVFNIGSNCTGATDWLDCHTLAENNNNEP